MSVEDRTYDLDYGPPEPPRQQIPWREVRRVGFVAGGGVLFLLVGLLIGRMGGSPAPEPAQMANAEATDAPRDVRPSGVIPETAAPEAEADLVAQIPEAVAQADLPGAEAGGVALARVEADASAMTEAAASETDLPLARAPPIPVRRPMRAEAEAPPQAENPTRLAQADQSTPAEAAIAEPAQAKAPAPPPGAFQDCPDCPSMVSLPGGTFQMGSPPDEPGRYGYEGPRHTVSVAPFALARTEVTFAQWDACVKDGGCRGYAGRDQGWGRDDRPALGISWNDARTYAEWLSKKTGRTYRLPSEAEWEYAARGGTETAYWWGAQFDASKVPAQATRPVDALPANPFGFTGMLGNAREWVADCYRPSYDGAPKDGSAIQSDDCDFRVIRGGSWNSAAQDLRAANRARIKAGMRSSYMGFRVAASP